MKPAKHVLRAPRSMAARWLVAAALLSTCAASSDVKEATNHLQTFLDQLHRRLSDQLELQKQQKESRQSWCHEKLQLLAEDGKRAEGVIEGLRGTIRKLKSTKDESIMLVQITEGMASNATTDSQELALQLSTKAQLAEAQERLSLRGISSSATHRFAAALRQACETSEKRSSQQEKALEEQVSLLQSSAEALSAAEALHGIDQSAVSDAARAAEGFNQAEVSLLQMASESATEIPDILSLFRRTEPASDAEDRVDELSLPFQSRREANVQEALPAMPEEQRPKVLELLTKMTSDEKHVRSKKESWCSEERSREQSALETARASATLFGADALAHKRVKAQLDDELAHVQKGGEECNAALQSVLEDSGNASQALDATRQDDTVAAKVVSKALDGLTSLREQWWGHATSNPVDAAMTSLASVRQSFQKQAEACEGLQKESADSAKLVTGRARELAAALGAEGRKLELTRDFYAKRQRRSESMTNLYDSQVQSAQSYLRNLEQTCGSGALEQQSHEMQAEVHALHDAEMVFSGQAIKAPHLLRGSFKSLSPVEQAALAMGVSVD